jgi:uncharacterized protein
MIKVSGTLQLSASDLAGHLNCRHLTDLEVEAASGVIKRPHFHDPSLEILWQRGDAHEQQYVAHLSRGGSEVVRIEGSGITQMQIDATLAAMKRGVPIIVQGALQTGTWRGRTDVLQRVATPSELGAWSYEVIDTKLARETRGGTILQLSLYSELLSVAQGLTPEYMYVVTPGIEDVPQRYRTAAYAAYFRSVKHSLEQMLATRAALSTYPEPQEHCEICRWIAQCDARRRRDDHLCLVAGITKVQRSELTRRAVATTTALSAVPIPLQWKPERGVAQSYVRIREQARVQVTARQRGQPLFETLDPAAGVGLALLPAPSPGDVFFDLEADPFVGEGGIEYLFGYVIRNAAGEDEYVREWAFTRAEERRAFERFVDFIVARRARYPDMHVYHYAAYEPGALKRLMGRYATREDEIDRMLRGGVLVDLYTVARQGVRASVESYSIKNLEVFYGFERPTSLPDARRALMQLQGCLELERAADITDQVMATIEAYNRDDCISAQKLRDWLERLRAEFIATGNQIARPASKPEEPSEELDARQQQVAQLVAHLTRDVPDDAAHRTAEQHARFILAHTLNWHRREDKTVWWEFYRLAALPVEDLFEERPALSGLTFVENVGGTMRAPIHRYTFPPQETELRGDESLHMPGGQPLGKLVAISLEHRTVDIKKRQDTAGIHPPAAFAHEVFNTREQAEALMRIGKHVAERGLTDSPPYLAAKDLLLRRSPRLAGDTRRGEHETPVAAAVRIVGKMTAGVLPIQGPPGSGKTHTAAQMICALVLAGRRVGITANSHKVIRHLLDKVMEAADKTAVGVRCIQKPDDVEPDTQRLAFARSNEEVLNAIRSGRVNVAGGTSWLWAREEFLESVDVLFVDEAAQMSLANVLAVSQACKTLVLLGDPRQLEQPTRGSHPEGTDVSALDHLLGDKQTIAADEGLFLDETWRLHPHICAFTSELFYEGRLRPHAGLERQIIRSRSRINGTGLRYLPVEHEGNQNSSPEEATRIGDLVREILAADTTWIDREGKEKPLRLEDILIIAPYNAQVFEMQDCLPGARIGTVDKFQGQEAPIVIYSMTTSTHADAPRGMEFLYSLNRLNVATSRARCLCILVSSPRLFEPECRTPRQMELANAFCRFLEMATVL